MSRFASISVDDLTLARAQRGEPEAQKAIYVAYRSAVFDLALRVLADRGLAEDATQDTFITMIQKIKQLKDKRRFAFWLRSIALNKVRSGLRSPWHKRRASDFDEDSESVKPSLHTSIDLERALSRLSVIPRTVVWLFHVEGMTHAEIAHYFGKSESFSKSQLSRAHEKMRGHLVDYDKEVALCTPV